MAVFYAENENGMINVIDPIIVDGSTALEEARDAAVADVCSSVASYTKLPETPLGKIVYLQQESVPSYSFPMLGFVKAQVDGNNPEIDHGEEEDDVSVTIQWDLTLKAQPNACYGYLGAVSIQSLIHIFLLGKVH